MLMLLAVVAVILFVIATFKYPSLSLAAFLTTAFIKGALLYKFSFFRVVDYTVLCASLVLFAMAYSFISNYGRIKDILSAPVWLYLSLAVLLLFGTTYTSAPHYGFIKSSRFVTFGLIALLAPVVFGKSTKDLKLMILIGLVCGIVLSIGTIIAPHAAVVRGDVKSRGSFLEASTLTTASNIAWSVIIFFVFLIMKDTPFRLRIVSLIMIPALIVGMVLTGSRGPFIGIILLMPIAMFVCKKRASKVWQPFVIAIMVVTFIMIFALLSEQLTSRISNMWKSSYDTSQAASSRTRLFSWAIERIPERIIMGHGTGAWAVDWGGVDEQRYPHNMILEVLYEQGLVGLSVLLPFLYVIFRRWRQSSGLINYYGLDTTLYLYTHIAGLLFLFSLFQAMKSGDLIDNRAMFFCAGLVIAAFNLARTYSEQVVSDEQFYEGDIEPAKQTVEV